MAKETSGREIKLGVVFAQTAIMFGGKTEFIVNASKMPGVSMTYFPDDAVIKLEKKGFKTHWLPITNCKHYEEL